jgi:glycerophosphoryl diester phosphodiesterase
MKTRIIGHRGAAFLELENTLASIKKAAQLGVDAIEFDVRLTRDRQVVLCHDETTQRVSSQTMEIASHTYKELRAVTLNNGEHLPLLSEALTTAGTTPVIIELKVENSVRPVLKTLEAFPKTKATIASFKYREIALLKELAPNIPGYVANYTSPLESVYTARAIDAEGVDLNFWILNPLTYILARRYKLDVMVYTVDNRFFAWFIHLLYPHVMICTNRPEYFAQKEKPHARRTGKN